MLNSQLLKKKKKVFVNKWLIKKLCQVPILTNHHEVGVSILYPSLLFLLFLNGKNQFPCVKFVEVVCTAETEPSLDLEKAPKL